MKKQDDSGCTAVLVYAGLGVAVYLGIKIYKFFERPDAVEIVLERLEAVGICLGLAVLVMGWLSLAGQMCSTRPYPKLTRLSDDYSVRGLQVAMGAPDAGDQPQAHTRESDLPVYLLVSLNNYGIGLAALPVPDPPAWVPADNAERYKFLSGERPGPVILPSEGFQLRYNLQTGESVTPPGPPPGSGGSLEGPLGSSLPGQPIEIVIDYTAILEPRHRKHTISLEAPLRLSLLALDSEGHEDPEATRALYDAIYQQTYVRRSSDEDDDAWMYRSRPTMWPFT